MRFTHKTVELLDFKALTNDRPGTFEAVVACWTVDRADEVIAKGAFAESISKSESFPVVWSHDWAKPPIGKSLSAEETDQGLKVKGRLFVGKSQLADEVYTAMQEGALKEWSFGAGITSERFEERDGRQVTVLESLDLIEFGPCLKGVNPNTYTVGLKAAEQAALTQLQKSNEGDTQEKLPDPTVNRQEITNEDARLIVATLFD